MFLSGILAAAALLFLVFKLGFRRVISYDLTFDVLITGVLLYTLGGTFSGAMAALIGGLAVSIVLFVLKRTMIREQLMTVKTSKFPYRSLAWITILPKQRN